LVLDEEQGKNPASAGFFGFDADNFGTLDVFQCLIK